jgi:hypothetical protein
MALAMARPWKHPKTGVYYLRKGVPENLRPLIGKREEKQSLGTRDPAEAKRGHAQALAELEARWTNLSVGPRTLTEREAHELACLAHDRWLERHRDNPSEQDFWPVQVGDKVFAPRVIDTAKLGVAAYSTVDPDWLLTERLEAWCLQIGDEILAARGLRVDEPSRIKLGKAVAAAIQRASLMLGQMARGEFGTWLGALSQPPQETTRPVPADARQPVWFDDLINGWATEKRPVEKTVYEWRRSLRQLESFIGHDDAGD